MFYPRCPLSGCGGKSESNEPGLQYAKHAFTQWLGQQAAANHPHPYVKAALFVGTSLYEVYKRVPGGGEKRCKSCGYIFC